jgi:hypothetical protein
MISSSDCPTSLSDQSGFQAFAAERGGKPTRGFSKVSFGTRIAEGSEAAVGDGFEEGEVVSPEEIDMSPNQRREGGDIGRVAARAPRRDLAKGFLDVDGVPIGEAEGSEFPEHFPFSTAMSGVPSTRGKECDTEGAQPFVASSGAPPPFEALTLAVEYENPIVCPRKKKST